MAHREPPVAGSATICRALSIPDGWTAQTAEWVTAHADLVSGVGVLLVCVGILSLPAPDAYGGDISLALEWRSPSTAVLGLAGVLQVHTAVWEVAILVIVLLGAWTLVHRGSSYHATELVAAALGALFLAALFVLVYTLSWLFTRDVHDALRRDGDA